MHSREAVGLFLLAREEGMTVAEAADFAGASRRAAKDWTAGRLPHSYTGKRPAPRSARMGGDPAPGRKAEAVAPRGLYDPPASGPLSGLTPDQVENLLLRAVLAGLKAGGWDPASISNRRKCELGERLRLATGLPLRSITAFLRISRSSYEYHRARLGTDRDAALRPLVREAFETGRGAYGYRRVHAELRLRGVRVSEKVVRRVMREEGLEARRARRRRYSSYEGEPDARPRNLPREQAAARRAAGEAFRADHDFSADRPGRLLVTDVTELSLGGRRCYLGPVVDCFDGMPVSWSLSGSPDAELCVSSLRDALRALPGGSRPTVHTDGGGPYRSLGWKGLCAAAGVERSMSRPGRSGDNAPAEGFFGTLKTEFFHGRDWAGVGVEEFRRELGRYMSWYREGRLKRFGEDGGGCRYDTIAGRRRRLGLAM